MSEPAFRTGVVAIGRDEGERLKRCLRSLQNVRGPVTYVDSASTDGSAEEARALGAQVVPLDVTQPFTAARARAAGVAAMERDCRAPEFLFFVDGDCEVEEGFVESAENFLDRHSDVATVCGRRRERFPHATRYNALIDREWNTPVGEALACGGDAVYRYSAYREAGGFDPAMLAGEEPELCARLKGLGWRIFRMDVPMTVHDAAMTEWSQWWGRAVRSGMGYLQAWLQTRRHAGRPLYGKELLRSVLWAGVLPLVALVLSVVLSPLALLIWPLVTAAQYARLARRSGGFAAWLSIAGKYAELTGIIRYAVRAIAGRSGSTVHYK